jgi:DNA-binding NtrC family response regulator
MKNCILIIDDNEKICKSLKENFEKIGYGCITAASGEEALETITACEINTAILDLKLGEENGITILEKIRELNPGLPVLILTGFGTIETAVEAIKIGAFDYLQKPVNFTKLQKTVENAVTMNNLETQNRIMQKKINSLSYSIVSRNVQMLGILENSLKLAATDLPILIVGESGTGKELVADFIHQNSDRKIYTLEKINCASFPESLLDNELFGHERGAYTGADASFKGVFERAHGGSLFLDEIGDMPLSIQSKILRTLQNHEIRRLGGKETRKVDVRFIAATNKNLQDLMEAGKFRQDLFYRLNAAMISIPALRDRKEDISFLSTHFLQELAEERELQPAELSDEVTVLFHEYSWPGNVRELKNVIKYAGTVTNNTTICLNDLPPYLFNHAERKESLNLKDDVEKELISRVLKETNYNKKRAAEILRICRKTLYNKIEKYGIPI